MPPNPLLVVVSERLDNHIESDDEAWTENKETLERMEGKLDTACEWITQQKTLHGAGKYIAGVMGGLIVWGADKVWP